MIFLTNKGNNGVQCILASINYNTIISDVWKLPKIIKVNKNNNYSHHFCLPRGPELRLYH